MWIVEFEPHVLNRMRLDAMNGSLSSEDGDLIKKWVEDVLEGGPESIQNDGRWDDHPLDAEWRGYRSSCFSSQGRIIYRIDGERILVIVVKVTTSHDYKRSE